jgi:hypothetical protein
VSRCTATIRVLCRADGLDETTDLLAWATGHPITSVEQAPASDTRWLLIRTDLEYHGDDWTILGRFGLDLIGKVAGVLSWEVVPTEAPEDTPSSVDGPGTEVPQKRDEQGIKDAFENHPGPNEKKRPGPGW